MKYLKYKSRKNNFRIRNELLYSLDLIICGASKKKNGISKLSLKTELV